MVKEPVCIITEHAQNDVYAFTETDIVRPINFKLILISHGDIWQDRCQ